MLPVKSGCSEVALIWDNNTRWWSLLSARWITNSSQVIRCSSHFRWSEEGEEVICLNVSFSEKIRFFREASTRTKNVESPTTTVDNSCIVTKTLDWIGLNIKWRSFLRDHGAAFFFEFWEKRAFGVSTGVLALFYFPKVIMFNFFWFT